MGGGRASSGRLQSLDALRGFDMIWILGLEQTVRDGEVKVTRSADGRYGIPLRSSKCAFVMGVPPTCF